MTNPNLLRPIAASIGQLLTDMARTGESSWHDLSALVESAGIPTEQFGAVGYDRYFYDDEPDDGWLFVAVTPKPLSDPTATATIVSCHGGIVSVPLSACHWDGETPFTRVQDPTPDFDGREHWERTYWLHSHSMGRLWGCIEDIWDHDSNYVLERYRLGILLMPWCMDENPNSSRPFRHCNFPKTRGAGVHRLDKVDPSRRHE